jgi:5'-phosphate synthase pdxT subunit
MHAVFIRAPVIESVGPGVDVLAELRGGPVVVREANVIAATFHPELAGESGLHRLLIEGAKR